MYVKNQQDTKQERTRSALEPIGTTTYVLAAQYLGVRKKRVKLSAHVARNLRSC